MPSRSQRHLREEYGADSSGSTRFPGYASKVSTTIADVGTTSATITFNGAPVPYSVRLSIAVTCEVDDTAIVLSSPVIVDGPLTLAGVATAVAAVMDDAQDVGTSLTLGATAILGDVITVTEDGGGDITTLTATITVLDKP